ncbi:MAG: hypothetical protein HDKAJFGB_04080 [Anaerolineae bacterium]|nr:hypothetical protein [Anaerolineae bacterium]
MGDRQFAPMEGGENRGGVLAEQNATQRFHIEFSTFKPALEHPEQDTQSLFEEFAGVGTLVEHGADSRGQSHGGRKSVSPETCGGERKGPRWIVGRFELQDEENPVDGGETFMPKLFGQLLTIRECGQLFTIGGMIEHALDEAFNSLTRLDTEFLGDFRLLKPCFVDQFGNKGDPFGRCECQQEAIRIGHIPAAFPTGFDGNDDFRIGPSRVRKQYSQFNAVGEKTNPLALGEEHTLCDTQMAETVGQPTFGGSVEILLEGRGPDPQTRLAIKEKEPAVFPPFARFDRIRAFESFVTEAIDQGFDDMVPDSDIAAA